MMNDMSKFYGDLLKIANRNFDYLKEDVLNLFAVEYDTLVGHGTDKDLLFLFSLQDIMENTELSESMRFSMLETRIQSKM
ncbi:MAG: hypothetical protein J6P28_00995 [Treponema sp.]|nr:hypothetical protein [Treponema sp.]